MIFIQFVNTMRGGICKHIFKDVTIISVERVLLAKKSGNVFKSIHEYETQFKIFKNNVIENCRNLSLFDNDCGVT